MSEEKPRKVPRVVSCLVKGPFGCLAFVVGAIVVIVLFGPPALGRLADRTLESWFAEHHEGSLQLTDVWLGSLYAEQHVESFILRDPGGDEVLRGSMRAPALWGFIGERDLRYGPVEIHVNTLRLVEQEDGDLNLLRAWREREEAQPDEQDEVEFDSRSHRGLRSDVPVIVELVLTVDRLRLLDRRGSETVLTNLDLLGSLELNNDDLRLVLEGGCAPARPDALHVRVELERLEGRAGVAWKQTWSVQRLPTLLAEHLVLPRLPLEAAAGPLLDDLRWSRQGRAIVMHIEDQGASLALEGSVSEDGFALEGREDQPADLTLPLRSAGAAQVLGALLPFVRRFEAGSEDATLHARLAHFLWPLEGDLGVLSGDLELGLGAARFELDPALQARLTESGLALADGELSRSLRLEEGSVELAGFRLPLEGGWLELDGQCDLASQRCELTLRAEAAGVKHELGTWEGDARAFAPSVPVPPAPLEPPDELPDKR